MFIGLIVYKLEHYLNIVLSHHEIVLCLIEASFLWLLINKMFLYREGDQTDTHLFYLNYTLLFTLQSDIYQGCESL